jgi:hypothetical protein
MPLDIYFIWTLCHTQKKNKSRHTHKRYKTYASIMEYTTPPIRGAQFNFK